jgi:hypothetical protein
VAAGSITPGSAFIVACRVSGVSTMPPRSDHLRHHLEDARMQRIVEILRLEERADALHRLVVDQERAEQSLLDFSMS